MPKKKKSRKNREEGPSGKEKGKGKAVDSSLLSPDSENGGGARIEEVDTSGDSRPASRAARVEDAPDDD